MKTKLLFSSLFTFYFLLSPCLAQVPQGFNYQAIARDGSGNPITNAPIKVKLSILSDTTGFYLSGTGTYIWEEEQTNVKTNTFGLFTVIFGNPLASKVQGSAASFSAIDWAKTPLYIGTKIANPTSYNNMGSAKLWSVPYSMVTDSTKALLKGSKLSVVSSNDLGTDALFEVKRKDGQTVFAVYPDAVNIYVPRTAKGAKGGFAIGGFDQVKLGPQDYFRVTPDSVRIYIDKTPTIVKGTTKGGFAIGGFDQAKGGTQDLLTVSNDSIRMYINDLPVKGTKGGFAIGGFDQVKGSYAKFLNVETSSTGIINPSQNKILWYPIKNAFLAGKVLIEKPDSVGVNSFATGYESKAIGQYSQAMGYKSVARGDYATAIGKNAVASNTNSFAFGDQAKATNFDSYAFGSGAEASGNKSFAFGSIGIDSTGIITDNTKATGDYAFAFGLGSVASGKASVAFGANNIASGSFATAMGYKTNSGNWYTTSMGAYTTASGFYTVAIGFKSTASGIASVALGNQSTASGVYSFACGDGARAIGARSVALGAFSNAQGAYSFAVGYSSVTGPSATASTALGRETNASATYSTAIGYQSASSGIYSLAGGNVSTASGISSIALGDHANASANYSIALGRNVTASTQYAIAIGNTTTASGDNSTAFGNQTTANGKYSLAVGYGCNSNAYASTALGSYNVIEGTPGSWIVTDPIFVVGNGTSSSSLSNAVTVYKDGTMKLKSNFYPELPAATLGTAGNKWNTVYATNGTINTSDARLKKNIEVLGYGLESILQLEPVSFQWKDGRDNNKYLGLLAQDVQKVISEIVNEGDDKNKTLGINYSQLVPVLIKGIQEQQKQIEFTKLENQQLRTELDELKILVNTHVANLAAQGNK